jgi:hypothetical protein
MRAFFIFGISVASPASFAIRSFSPFPILVTAEKLMF